MSSEIGQNQAFSQQRATFPETFTAFFYLKQLERPKLFMKDGLLEIVPSL
jgi:hypothetical protein